MNPPFILQREQWVPRPVEEVFAFFADARNLEVLTPPWLHFKILTPQPIVMAAGARLDYRLSWHGVPLRWQTEIVRWQPTQGFEDVQRSGPYRLWRHTHHFEAEAGGTRLTDVVRYALPFGLAGRAVHALIVRGNVEAIFDYRSEIIRKLMGEQEKGSGG